MSSAKSQKSIHPRDLTFILILMENVQIHVLFKRVQRCKGAKCKRCKWLEDKTVNKSTKGDFHLDKKMTKHLIILYIIIYNIINIIFVVVFSYFEFLFVDLLTVRDKMHFEHLNN